MRKGKGHRLKFIKKKYIRKGYRESGLLEREKDWAGVILVAKLPQKITLSVRLN